MKRITVSQIILSTLGLGLLLGVALVYRHYRIDMDEAYRRIEAGGKVIQTACGPIEYTEFGEGAPMLIVHGSGGGYAQGVYFARLIGGNFRWIAPSRFGFLGTPAPNNASSELQADAHACLLDALGIERVGLVGCSLGGPSALMFTQRHPERVTSLVMASAASHAIPDRPGFQAAVFKVFLNDFFFWGMVHLMPGGLLDLLGVPAAFQKELPAGDLQAAFQFLEDIIPMGARLQGQLLEERMSRIDETLVRQIQAPTLVVHAKDDTLVTFDHAEFTAQEVPGAQLIAEEKGGHLAFLFTVNRQALEQVLQFLEKYNP